MLINDIITETTSGGIAIVASPMGKMQKRPNPSVFAKSKKRVSEDTDPKADPEIVAKFARVSDKDRSYYIMKWAEEKGINSDDAMCLAGYVRDGYIGAGAWNWAYRPKG
jgi:hypothetical protein